MVISNVKDEISLVMNKRTGLNGQQLNLNEGHVCTEKILVFFFLVKHC